MSLVSGPGRGGSRPGDIPAELQLFVDKHVQYIQSLDTRKDELEYWLTEHLRVNGLYWGLTALHLLGHPEALPREEVIEYVLSCQHDSGGFGAAPGHDAHMLYTVSAVQILVTLDAVDELSRGDRGGKEKVGRFIADLQDSSTGSFAGDEWGETDTRFLFGALNALSLLHLTSLVDMPKAVAHVQACANFDGGYGVSPGAESHAGQIYACVGALAIADRLDLVDKDRLGGWLSERQLENGGLNGRPEKLEDSCYSWWVGSSLAMIDRLHWIDGGKLANFILKCQDPDKGGLSDRPGDMVDDSKMFIQYSHLSHYFKVKVRSNKESEARELLESYDRWYEQHGVERLLSKRMVLKDKKHAKASKTARTSASTPASNSGSKHSHTDLLIEHDELLDPELSRSAVLGQGPSSEKVFPSVEPPSRRVFVPRMRLWPTSALRGPDEMSETRSDASNTDSEGARAVSSELSIDELSEYEELQDYLNYQSESERDSASLNAGSEELPFVLEGTLNGCEDSIVEAQESNLTPTDSAKLKGIVWPGMNIFDSATPAMQRKRNQKKDKSVLEQMILNSTEVEPKELIFYSDGTLKKQRRISDTAEPSSPILSDGEPPKGLEVKQQKRPGIGARTAKGINAIGLSEARDRRGKQIKAELGRMSRRALAMLDDDTNTLPRISNHRYSPDAGEEYGFSAGELQPKNRKINVFDERVVNHQSPPTLQHVRPQMTRRGHTAGGFQQPYELNLLSSEFAVPSYADSSPRVLAPGNPNVMSNASAYGHVPSYGCGNDDKENLPMMGHPTLTGNQFRRSWAGASGQKFSPEVFNQAQCFPSMAPPEYGDIYGPRLYGYTPNPLVASFQQHNARESQETVPQGQAKALSGKRARKPGRINRMVSSRENVETPTNAHKRLRTNLSSLHRPSTGSSSFRGESDVFSSAGSHASSYSEAADIADDEGDGGMFIGVSDD
ncbi:MAG: hypothetical protein M1819_003615 [Sarea resinae]|nr:MAG: hypothetical protein M1819_003615 [Sarea resinae]